MGALFEEKMPGKKATKKAPAAGKPAKTAGKKANVQEGKPRNPLFKSRPKIFGVGGALRPKGSTNLYRFVKWPRYVKLQRQKQVLMNRIKVPPAINQFRHTLDKKKRLKSEAKARADGKAVQKSKPVFVKYGLQNVTALVEQNAAKLVVIAHDVDPIELVLWLPTLCQKKKVPYVIVKGKARLGQVIGMKNAACLAITDVRPEDRATLTQLSEVAVTNFNSRALFFRRTWGGLALGVKSQHRRNLRERIAREEAAAAKSIAKK